MISKTLDKFDKPWINYKTSEYFLPKCKYCGDKISDFDYKNNNGLCLKCNEVQDWKNILKDI